MIAIESRFSGSLPNDYQCGMQMQMQFDRLVSDSTIIKLNKGSAIDPLSTENSSTIEPL